MKAAQPLYILELPSGLPAGTYQGRFVERKPAKDGEPAVLTLQVLAGLQIACSELPPVRPAVKNEA